MRFRLLIRRLGGQVDTARPGDRPRLGINRDPSEVSGVIQRRVDAEQRLISPRPFPVRQDVVVPEQGPFPDDLQLACLGSSPK